MSEFLSMGGYAFYVWTSIGLFLAVMLIDFINLINKEKHVKRSIKSLIKRRKTKSK